jgi:hypothetical protein
MAEVRAVRFQCCFCSERAGKIDNVTRLTVLQPDGGEQELYAHPECLRRAVHASVPLAL